MSMMETGPGEWGESRTKQAFKDQCDINKILKKAQRAGSLSHLVKHGAHYGDFSDVPDLLTANARIQAGQSIYDELPSELKREFPDMYSFFEYVNNPENQVDLRDRLPALAEPGRQRPDVRRSAASEANPAIDSGPPEAAAEPATGDSTSSPT